jgi:hypothetical protein
MNDDNPACLAHVFSYFHAIDFFIPSIDLQAAFHGSADAAKALLSKDEYDGITLGLHLVADKEGKTPIDLAKDENNDHVAKVINEAADSSTDLDTGATEGMRKRK